ncbi:GntR family transcriptional regulator [Brevibacillus fluminis]|uniref:GntR family transcriptional regulator n=1 Tax=Brevibacillus fluminis TaxID=511487 RepID=UPI003F8AE9FE
MSTKPFLLKHFNPASKIPKYLQIREAIRGLIEKGIVVEQQTIPPERDLAEWFGVSRMTVRQAVDELVREGLLEKRLGDGTFVKDQKLAGRMHGAGSFSDEIALSGKRTHSKMLGQLVTRPSEQIAKKLEIEEGETSVIRIERIRYVNEYPISHQVSYLPFNLCYPILSADLNVSSLYHHLAQSAGLVMKAGKETIQVITADEMSAELLQIPVGEPCFLLCRTMYADKVNRPVEYVETMIRGDKFMFVNQIDGKGIE